MKIKLAIRGADLIDGVGLEPTPSCVVLIGADGRIASVGLMQELTVPEAIPTVDATGMTLMPGLIDGHQHLTYDKTLYSAHSVGEVATSIRDEGQRLVRAGHYAQLALTAGVTTVRDCGADDFSVLALRDMVDTGYFVGHEFWPVADRL